MEVLRGLFEYGLPGEPRLGRHCGGAMTTVAAGLLECAGRLLICRRRDDQDHPGKWEFPGGKAEPGEGPLDTLRRELREELGIRTHRAEEILTYEYTYAGRRPVRLVFFRVLAFSGSVQTSQFAEARWEPRELLPIYPFLEGDERIVRLLASRQL